MPSDPVPRIEAQGLHVAYPGRPVIEGLDLALPARSLTALVGPNGCGKSTLLRALAGLAAPRAGRVLLDGAPVTLLGPKRLARRVAMLPQSPVAPEGLRVEDLVRQGRYPHRALLGGWSAADAEAVARALRLTRMEDFSRRPLDALSGGQRQRAWIAMTLAQAGGRDGDAAGGALLLDEPTTYLDIAHQEEVMALMRALVDDRGATVVAVLHDLNQAARFADRIVMMKAGAVAAEGAPRAVLTPERIAAVFGLKVVVAPSPVDGAPMAIPAASR